MQIVLHRANSAKTIARLPPHCGAEIDIRSHRGRLTLSHEPHRPGEPLHQFLKSYSRTHAQGLLIANPKEDGLEQEILAQFTKFGLRNFFFLDLTIPTVVRLVKKNHERRIAVRVSEFEPISLARRFAGLARWCWVDCFRGHPPALSLIKQLRQDFKVCLVSPELQGFPATSIRNFKKLSPYVDAVCTDFPAVWS